MKKSFFRFGFFSRQKLIIIMTAIINSACQLPFKDINHEDLQISDSIFILPDTAESLAVCHELQKSVDVYTVICEEHQKLNHSLKIKIIVTLEDNSSNLLKNIKRSLMTLTTGLFISNEAVVNFIIRIERKGHLKVFNLSDRMETGMWTVMPVHGGLAGTIIGGILNRYRRPDRLRSACLHDTYKIGQNHNYNSKLCEEYMNFIAGAFRKIEIQFMKELNHETSKISKF